MANQSQATEAQPEKKRRPQVEPVAVAALAGDLAGLAALPGGPLTAAGGSTVQAQATRLGDQRFQTVQRQALAARVGQVQGNGHLQGLIAIGKEARLPATVQMDRGRRGRGAHPGGRGAGRIQHATTRYYDVSGATLDDITGQLHRIDGYASETNAPITIRGRVRPRQVEGVYQVRVQWIISGAAVTLPRWRNYDTACPAAQREWDRFMGQARAHEQQAHVDAARTFVQNLGEEDTVITGATVAELRQNLVAKQQDLATRLQAIHDSCDHGASIDAILHPERGRCSEEE